MGYVKSMRLTPCRISDKVIAGKEYTGLRGHFVRIQGAITGA